MKHRRRFLAVLSISLALVAAIAILGVRSWIARPPRPISLLPEGDLLFYANLKPLHLFALNAVKPNAEYKDFIEQTGIQPERDLDEVSMSRHDPGRGADIESSEIFSGRFDSSRLTRYLERVATGREHYADKTIYTIPHEGHTVRVCALDDRMVAVTNMVSSSPIRSIIEKYRHNSTFFGQLPSAPYLAEGYYQQLPAASLAWVIYHIPPETNKDQLLGINLDFLQDKISVASLRYAGSLSVSAKVFAENPAEAKRLMDSATTFLALYRTVALSTGAKGADPDVKAVFESIKVEQEENKLIVNATIPDRFLQKIWSAIQADGQSEPETTPAKK
ncbi:MAG TPA: hypothetical protein VKZ53_14080 [Candidatus Angelobacter sp.]|nr:hypothetical protein [Candidatus Angelobacter sp.]